MHTHALTRTHVLTHTHLYTHIHAHAHTARFHPHMLTHTLTSSKNKQSSSGTVQTKFIFKRNFLKQTSSTKMPFYPQEDSRLPRYQSNLAPC